MPSCHSLVFYLFSLQIKIQNGLITIFEQGKTNFDGSLPPAKPLVDFYITVFLLWPRLACPLSPPKGPCLLSCPYTSVLPVEPSFACLSSASTLWVESDTNTCHRGKCLCHLPFVWGAVGNHGYRLPPPPFFVGQAWRSRMLR